MISRMRCYGFSVSCCWHDSIVLHLEELNISLKIVLLEPLFVLFLVLALLGLKEVPLVMLSLLTGHIIEHLPPLFGFVFFSVSVGYLMKINLYPIMFLLHSLGVPICVVHAGVFLDMGAVINEDLWGHSFSWID